MYDFSLDGFSALGLPLPQSPEEEAAIVQRFLLQGLEKLFTPRALVLPLPTVLSTDYCLRCNSCNDRCMIYQSSGRQDITARTSARSCCGDLPPLFHALGQAVGGMVRGGRGTQLASRLPAGRAGVSLQSLPALCGGLPIGVDNGLIAHEIRKLFSQEMGIAPEEIHDRGLGPASEGRVRRPA